MPKRIKLMADYGCDPLWWMVGSGKAGDIDPTTLPLKPETIERLQKWAAIYDGILNQDDPASSDFENSAAELAFDREGIKLWHLLRKELSPEYEVSYFSDRLGKLFTHPSPLEPVLSANVS